jgi:hypothetical protein
VPSLTSRWATGVVDRCFSLPTRGSTKVGFRVTGISWRSTPTGWADCDKPDCDEPNSTPLQQNSGAPQLDSALLCSNPPAHYATFLKRPKSAKATQTQPSRVPTRIYPLQEIWTSPWQCTSWLTSSTFDALAKTALMTSLSNGLGLTAMFLDKGLMNLGFFCFDTHSLVDNGRFHTLLSTHRRNQDCRASIPAGVSSYSQATIVVCWLSSDPRAEFELRIPISPALPNPNQHRVQHRSQPKGSR